MLLTQTLPGRYITARGLGVRLAAKFVRSDAPFQLAARLRVPLAVIHGRVDRFVEPMQAELLYGAAGGPRRLEIVDGMGHAYGSAAVPAVVDCVQWALSAAPQPATV